MKKIIRIAASLGAAFALFALPAPLSALSVFAAEAGGEITVTQDGKVSIKRAKVMQTANTNFFTRVSWGNVFIRVTVVTTPATDITKRYGEKAVPSDFKEGDMINIEGTFPNASESFIVNATSVKNLSLEKEQGTFSGTVTAVFPDRDEFKLATPTMGSITVTAQSASIKKGIIPWSVSQMKVGDKILTAPGTYDYSTKTLNATEILIYQNPAVFKKQNFQGKLLSVDGANLPVTLSVSVNGKNYSVRVPASAKIFNRRRDEVSISRFQVGDTVRFYGAIRIDDLSVVDNVELLRDTSF